MTKLPWYVCDMDEGVLRREPTRRAALKWLLDQACTTNVIERYAYGPGYYSYLVGSDREDSTDAAIVREDCLRRYGIDTPPDQIEPRYPYSNQPHEERDPDELEATDQ